MIEFFESEWQGADEDFDVHSSVLQLLWKVIERYWRDGDGVCWSEPTALCAQLVALELNSERASTWRPDGFEVYTDECLVYVKKVAGY